MKDAGFIIGSYGLVFASVGIYALWMLRASRRIARRVPDRDKPWL